MNQRSDRNTNDAAPSGRRSAKGASASLRHPSIRLERAAGTAEFEGPRVTPHADSPTTDSRRTAPRPLTDAQLRLIRFLARQAAEDYFAGTGIFEVEK